VSLVFSSGAATDPPATHGGDLKWKRIGDCRLEHPLGAGSSGVTWQAQHLNLERSVVVKLVQHGASQEGLDSYLKEGRALAKIRHPHVVAVLDAGEENGIGYLILELVEGGTLRDEIRRGPLGLERAIGVVRQAAEGLEAAHREGLVHRDVKPDNLLLTPSGEVKVADFGLAQSAQDGVRRTAKVAGTPAYMSPEQCMGRPLDARSDLYSLGVVLFECLLNRWPFNAPEPRLIMQKHVDTPVPIELLEDEGFPDALVEIVQGALKKDPNDRFVSCGELAAELERALETVRSASDVPRVKRRKRRSGRVRGSGSRRSNSARLRRSSSARLRRTSSGAHRVATSGRHATRQHRSGGDSLPMALTIFLLAAAALATLALVLFG
jgi:serine/threonine protein kinase